MFKITFSDGVVEDLTALTAHQRSRILDRIEVQLSQEPRHQTRNRKPLVGLIPPWEHVAPVWELRIGDYRVFYDVDEATESVMVRAIRHKSVHRTTEEIL